MKLRLTVRALADLEDICDYLRERNPSAASRVREAVEASFALISTYPLAGPARSKEIRRFTMPRYPYLIFYDVDEPASEVRVLSIRHAARRETD